MHFGQVGHLVAEHNLWFPLKLFWVKLLINFVEELLEVPLGDKITQETWETLFMRPDRIS